MKVVGKRELDENVKNVILREIELMFEGSGVSGNISGLSGDVRGPQNDMCICTLCGGEIKF